MADGTVYVVEDDDAVRESLLLLLRVNEFRARGFATAGAFLDAVDAGSAGCLLLDLRLPGTTGLELQRMLADRGFHMPVIIISAHGDLAAARTAFKAGALDFLEKPIQQAVLLPAIAAALEHDRSRRDRERTTAAFRDRMGRLSERERQVMWHVADGLQNREIAQLLGLSPRTIEIYKARMLEKLQVRRPAELVRLLQDVPREA